MEIILRDIALLVLVFVAPVGLTIWIVRRRKDDGRQDGE